MTNAYVFDGSLRQEFEHGHLRLSPDPSVALAQLDPATIHLHLVAVLWAVLPDLALNARIVRQRPGTAWYANADLQRRWIAHHTTFAILRGQRVIVASALPGTPSATLHHR